jgi:hypothetical protein
MGSVSIDFVKFISGCSDDSVSRFPGIDCPLSVGKLLFGNLASMSLTGVRRDKAALYQWVRDPPG